MLRNRVSWLFIGLACIGLAIWHPVNARGQVVDINFCPNNVGTATDLTTDSVAGVTVASSIGVPLSAASGGSSADVGVYFKNNGSGSITFASPSWSVKGASVPTATTTLIPLTPSGSSANFNDLGWGGTFGEGVAILGCISFANVTLARGQQATAHLDLSFDRGGVPYEVRVNVHFR